MSKNQKELDAYIRGMQHAKDLVEKGGLDELVLELNYRSTHELPMNVSPSELIAVARSQTVIHRELLTISTALAWACCKGMNFAPSQISKLLDVFNSKVDEIRFDDKALNDACEELSKYGKLNKSAKMYLDKMKERIDDHDNNQ